MNAAAARQPEVDNLTRPTAFERYLLLQATAAPAEATITPLPLAPASPVTRREVAWATVLTLLLLAGILGTLLLRTAMQTQARTLLRESQTASTLTDRTQQLRHTLTRDSNPESLAAKARALRMQPQTVPRFVTHR